MFIYFFQNYVEEVNNTTEKVHNFDLQMGDKRHEIELGNLSDADLIRNGRQQEKILKERRICKDYLDDLYVFKSFYEDLVSKCNIISRLTGIKSKLAEQQKNREERIYKPRVDTDMTEYDWCTDFTKIEEKEIKEIKKGMAFKIVYGVTQADRRTKYQKDDYYIIYANNGTDAVMKFCTMLSQSGKTYAAANIQAYPYANCKVDREIAETQTLEKIEERFLDRLEVN